MLWSLIKTILFIHSLSDINIFHAILSLGQVSFNSLRFQFRKNSNLGSVNCHQSCIWAKMSAFSIRIWRWNHWPSIQTLARLDLKACPPVINHQIKISLEYIAPTRAHICIYIPVIFVLIYQLLHEQFYYAMLTCYKQFTQAFQLHVLQK